jgi:RimJ/RimL family protein N-acetyltransferase
MIPTLETARLRLRGWKLEDFEAHARFAADPEVMRYLTGAPLSRADAWRNLTMTVGHWMLRGYGFWAVERKEDGAHIGRIGIHYPEGWPGLEVGWSLGREYWGKGYATEAAAAAMAYGFLTQNADRLISVIDPQNAASQAVALRLGETRGPPQELVIGGKTFTVDIWSISRAEWQRRSAP